MNILMIAPQPVFEPRGTPISVYQRLEGLSRLGHSIDLVTYHLGAEVDLPGVTIYRIPRVPFIKELKVGPSLPKLPLDILLFFKSIERLVRKKYDVIHSHEEAAVFSIPLAAIFRTRHLYDMHSSLPRQLRNFNFGNNALMIKIFEVLERWTVRKSDAIITIGSDLASHVEYLKPDATHMMIENLPLWSNGSKRTQSANSELRQTLGIKNKLAIVYTGTFERYQGVGLLLESAKIVRDQFPDVAFILVGGKPAQVQEWKEVASKNQLEDCVYFTGTLPVEEANRYLEIADILVSPRVEGTSVPLKIYTYLLTGKPIVATNLTAHTIVLNEDTAVLVDPEKEAFAEGLLRLIWNEDLRRQLGVRAQRLAEEKYSPAVYLSKLVKIYSKLQPVRVEKEHVFRSLDN
jgi:glycosyltransferase involved in cell wall biosynthesis